MIDIPLILVAKTCRMTQVIAEYWSILSDEEQARADRIRREVDRNDFIAAHLLVRRAVADLLNLGLSDVVIRQRCLTCGGPHGPAYVESWEEIFVSWSHSHGAVAAIAALSPVAIDLEAGPVNRLPKPDELRQIASESERIRLHSAATKSPEAYAHAFRQIWTYKECLIKLARLDLGRLSHITAPEGRVQEFSFSACGAACEADMSAGIPLYFRASGGIGAALVSVPSRVRLRMFSD